MGIARGGHRTLTQGERAAREGKPADLVSSWPTLNLRLDPALAVRMRECAALCEVSLNAFAAMSVADMCNRVQRRSAREEKETKEGNDHG